MELNLITPEVFKDDEAFKRLLILQATQSLISQHCNTFACANIAYEYANNVMKLIKKERGDDSV